MQCVMLCSYQKNVACAVDGCTEVVPLKIPDVEYRITSLADTLLCVHNYFSVVYAIKINCVYTVVIAV